MITRRRKKSSTTPTQRSVEELRKLGFIAQNVEKFNHHTKRRLDLFGCIDIIAARPGIGVLGVQACSGRDHSTRIKKAKAEPLLWHWLNGGGRFEVWSWLLCKEGNAWRWRVRREEIKEFDLAEPTPVADAKKIRKAIKPLAAALAGELFG